VGFKAAYVGGHAMFIEQALYDGLIAEWATKTGRPVR
jgi:hypothetical protein